MNSFLSKKDYTLVQKLAIASLWLLRTLALASIVQVLLDGNLSRVPMLLFWLLLTYSPTLIGGLKKLRIPVEFEAVIVAFIFATLFLGEFKNFYEAFFWWDSMLHVVGSIIFTFVGFIILTHTGRDPLLEKHPFLFSFICFCFGITIGSLWELYEFFMDSTFGYNMQPGGNEDTMWDMVLNVLGAATMTSVIYLHRIEQGFSALHRIINSFSLHNLDVTKD